MRAFNFVGEIDYQDLWEGYAFLGLDKNIFIASFSLSIFSLGKRGVGLLGMVLLTINVFLVRIRNSTIHAL